MAVIREHAELNFPHGIVDPLDWLRFVELKAFSRRREELKLTNDFIRALQISIMIDPQGSPVIPGTGGLRKMRCSRPDGSKGKRGGLRVCYVYFEHSGLVALITAYTKNEADDLTSDQKKSIQKMIGVIEQGLCEGKPKRTKE